MPISQHLPVTLNAADRTAALKAILRDASEAIVAEYADNAFTPLETNGRTRVLAYAIPDASFVGRITVWLADGSKEIGTVWIEPDYNTAAVGGGDDLEIDASEGFQVIT